MIAGQGLAQEQVLRPGREVLPAPSRPGTVGRLHARPKGKSFAGVLAELAWGACYESIGSHPMENPALCWDLLANQGKDNVFGSYGQLHALSFRLDSGKFSMPVSGRAGAENSGCRDLARRVVRSDGRSYSAERRRDRPGLCRMVLDKLSLRFRTVQIPWVLWNSVL